MEMKKHIISQEKLEALEAEINDLKVNQRKEIADKIKEAREQGDLSENAEYDAAKDEQRDIEARIEELENILKNVEVLDDSDIDITKVGLGCIVKLYDFEFEEEVTYSLVGTMEADILNNKISNESPVGMALIGSQVGDEVVVVSPSGDMKFKVLEIERIKK